MLKLLSLFSGIGAFEKALENIEEPFEIIRYCEIDKYASKAYSLIHNLDENMNLKDVTKVDTAELPDDIDLITYGFPCQDISQSGKQKGFQNDDGSLTRSGLFFEALRIIEETKPKIAIAENVKALTSKKFTAEFKIVLDYLNDAGYRNYWSVLNAKDYGIPQNRERVFIISIRDDIDHGFTFPAGYELKLRLKDMLEEAVDAKYYLSEKAIQGFLKHNIRHEAKGTGFKWNPTDIDGVAKCLRANGALAPTDNTIMTINEKPVRLFNIYGDNCGTGYAGNVWDTNGLAPALMTAQGGNRQPLIIDEYLPIKEATKKGYAEAHEGDYVNLQYPNSETRRGRVGEQCANTLLCNDAQDVVIKDAMPINTASDGTCRTLKAQYYKSSPANFKATGAFGATAVIDGLGIRKLTPKECFRLMGFDDKDCDILVENKISNTQLYKMAGNSIVVDVLEEIFVELLNQYENIFPLEGNNNAKLL